MIQLIAWFSKESSSQLNDRKKQNLCLDKAYHSKEVEQEIFNRGYIPHIRHRREEKLFHRTHPAARRWVVERTNSWLITDSGSCLQGMKKRMKTTLVLYSWQIV